MGGKVCVLDSHCDLYEAQPITYRLMSWATFFTEALSENSDFREIKLL